MEKDRPPKPNSVTLSDEILEQIESEPGFINMMEESERAMREGRTVSNEEALRQLRADIQAERRRHRRRA